MSESNARAEDLSVNICAVLLAEACNIRLEPLVKHHVPALTRHRLSWVKQNYLRTETLVRANAKLVDHQATLSLAKKWGGGEVASANGLRFVTPIRTINAGPNRKYFGSSRGITWMYRKNKVYEILIIDLNWEALARRASCSITSFRISTLVFTVSSYLEH